MNAPQLPYLRQGDGPIFVLVHGFLGGARQWQAQLDYFSDGFDVIAPNLPGFGDAADFTACNSVVDMAQSIMTLLDQLNISEYSLLGHSMGGMIAQEIAKRDTKKVKQLVLYATGPLGLMPDRFETIEQSKERFETQGLAPSVKNTVSKWFVDGADGPGYDDLVAIGEQSSVESAQKGLDAMASWDGRATLGTISMPTLVLWGEEDQSYRWPQIETLWRQIPTAHLGVIPSCSHAAHLEKPALFHLMIRDFLASN